MAALLGLAGCQSGADDDDGPAKVDQAQQAVKQVPCIRIASVNRAGAPTFIEGDLGRTSLSKSSTERELQSALAGIAPRFQLATSDLVHRGTVSDADGALHLRFAQRKHGLPVVGGDLLLHVRADGTVYAANGTAHDGVELSPVPTVSAADAQATLSRLEGEARVGRPELTYFMSPDGVLSLTWKLEVTSDRESLPRRDWVYLDGHTGAVVARHPQVQPTAIFVYNAFHQAGLPGSSAFPFYSPTWWAPMPDPVAYSHFVRIATVDSCYQTLFNRNSFDNASAPLVSTVHYATNYNNAFWNGQQLVFGDGDGNLFSSLALAYDVTAHEVTHAVTEHTAGLIYAGESGGMNESFSDVFASICSAYVDPNQTSERTWEIGEQVYTPATPGDALRYMSDPAHDGLSLDTYQDLTWDVDVHFSSGIGNLAFYLASQGGTHPRGRTSIQVPAIGLAHAQQVWYRALTVYLTPNSGFLATRRATIQAALDLYGSGDASAVGLAWDAVGVDANAAPPPPPPECFQ